MLKQNNKFFEKEKIMKMGTKRGMQKILSLFLVMIMLFSTIPVSATGEVEPPLELETPKAQLIISGESDNLPIKSITVTSDKGTSNEYSSLPITIDDLEIGDEINISIEALEGFNVVKSTDSIIIKQLRRTILRIIKFHFFH